MCRIEHEVLQNELNQCVACHVASPIVYNAFQRRIRSSTSVAMSSPVRVVMRATEPRLIGFAAIDT
jgi:hypothetical protein